MPYEPSAIDTPFSRIGGVDAINALVERFYDAMERDEPDLARMHRLDEQGRVSRESRDRFAMFLVGWLGGPQDYMARHGHPRLRMRHANARVDIAMRDAWLRCMGVALDGASMDPDVRAFLDGRFAEVANFLRNTHG